MLESVQLTRRTLGIVAAAAMLTGGCATKGFVRKYVETEVAPQREAITKLQGDVAHAQTSADSADSHARNAETLATNAMDEASAARRLASKIASGDLKYSVVEKKVISFGYDQFTLNHRGRGTLDNVAATLEQHPRWIVEVVGTTDNAGSPRYNLRLGQERAETVRRYLNDKHQVPLSKIATISFGEGKATSRGEGKGARSRDRRAEIRILEVQDADLVTATEPGTSTTTP